jgi:uncharacterized protein with predicted RNA binding PUA domain
MSENCGGSTGDGDSDPDPDAGSEPESEPNPKSEPEPNPEPESEPELDRLRTVADYQFGAGAGRALFPRSESLDLRRSGSGRPRQVIADAGRVVSYGTDGLFTLGIEGGRRLADAFAPPRLRVVVGDESDPYVREGYNAFAKFVREVDPAIRPGDEVLVVGNDALLGVGRAELSASAIEEFDTGMAVAIREGAGSDTIRHDK